MIFTAIQNRFKVKSGLRYLEDELANERNIAERAKVANIACIVDMDNFNDLDAINELRTTLNLKPNGIHIIGFKRNDVKKTVFSIPFVTEKQLGWNGSIENDDFSEFANREYDVLLNYFTEDLLMLKLMSVKTRAGLKVGLKEADTAINDLMIDCNFGDFATFGSELKKYLKILKKLD